MGGAALLLLTGALLRAQEGPAGSVIAPADMRPDGGFCYTVALPAPCSPDTAGAPTASCLRVYEGDQELGPAHTLHQTIRTEGAGAYSHWSGDAAGQTQVLYFSASDNTDPRQNGRTYRWCILKDAKGNPLPPSAELREVTACALAALPDKPLGRDRHTTLLADFDSDESNAATYARVHRAEVGVGSLAAAPGKWGGGVAVTAAGGSVMFPGLDNYNPLQGTAEFWAQARGPTPLWNDGQEHWLLVLYPERAAVAPRHGSAPCFVALAKMPDNSLRLSVQRRSLPHYAVGVGLRQDGPAVRVPVADLAPEAWHHILISWDLRERGQVWLLVDGQGVSARLRQTPGWLPPGPGMNIVFGGLWGLPGDGIQASACNLDELRLQDQTVAGRLAGAVALPDAGLDEARLLQEMDVTRALLDKLLELQFHGGWASAYQWPTYTPTGWGLVGRGVDMWFAYSSWAGAALLRGWRLWGDDRYLEGAIEAAEMFCRTQRANGSWSDEYTYGRGEFAPWGNYAYIAQAMQSNQIRFLALLYKVLGQERYGEALRRAGDWTVSIQFPSGAWGWEAYPQERTGPYGHPALNDAVTPQAMADLFVIWCATGDEKYLHPITKGAQWIMAAQAGPPTYGWADQYGEQNEFIWMREFEPPAVSMQAISAATWGLCLAYDLTGDAAYLEPLRKVLGWLDSVPKEQQGWLWYDPATRVPVVAYHHEMLPVTHPKAIAEMIPRLDAHYGTKFPWQADRIRAELTAREHGPVYPDWRGQRPRATFGQAPTLEDCAAACRADRARASREWLAAWAAGTPPTSASPEYGRTLDLGAAVSHCQQLLADLECAQVARRDVPIESLPRYRRNQSDDWVFMDPQRDFYRTPLRRAE